MTTQELIFEDVEIASMPLLLYGIEGIASATCSRPVIEVQCTGRDRAGEVLILNKEYHLLAENRVTSRKQFFTVVVNGKAIAVRPENDTFSLVRVSYHPLQREE